MQKRLDADATNSGDAAHDIARARRAVLVIAIAQLLGTSLWFSANGAMRDLQIAWQLSASDIGWLTNAVQAGFIVGTLLSATTGLADRVSASKVFAVCGVLGATLNALFALCSSGLASALVFRFGVGVALAGIYPLGMTIKGRTPENTPKWIGNIALTHRPLWLPGLSLTVRASFITKRPVNPQNQGYIPGYTIYSLGASYATRIAGKHVDIRVAVDNLFNKRYWNSVQTGTLGTGMDRSVRMVAKIDF